MRGHEDSRTQEKCEDVCPLKEGGVNDNQTAAMGMLVAFLPGHHSVPLLTWCSLSCTTLLLPTAMCAHLGDSALQGSPLTLCRTP